MEPKTVVALSEARQSSVICQCSSGLEIQTALLRFTRHVAVFELYSPSVVLRTSEVLNLFKIVLGDQTVYSGRAVVNSLVDVGDMLVCEATLEDHWANIPPVSQDGEKGWQSRFSDFLRQWQKSYKINPEFKLVVADLRSLLADLRLWMAEMELSIRPSSTGEPESLLQSAAHELATPVLSVIDSLGDRFEEIASGLDPELRPAHVHFTRRNLHSLLLCSPFGNRTFSKPLGYAGDYEMVSMILRNPYEGGSLYAKVVNAWFLNQLPAQGHRNRIKFLKNRLIEETSRVKRSGNRVQILNLGCGPANEILEFLAESDLCNKASFTLLDFNEETIQSTSRALSRVSKRFSRKTPVQIQKKSVQQLLKEAAKSTANPADGKYDFIYCAGLFDYLPDRVCKQLVGLFYQWLAPGGVALVTNVDGTRPFRNKLEFILDWNLIYRTGRQLSCLQPEQASADGCSVKSDSTGVNVFLEIRKPNHG
jgi:extracellular factor (EF) 3-hydroxypalmitic acid methyl ester biosynthesis protein